MGTGWLPSSEACKAGCPRQPSSRVPRTHVPRVTTSTIISADESEICRASCSCSCCRPCDRVSVRECGLARRGAGRIDTDPRRNLPTILTPPCTLYEFVRTLKKSGGAHTQEVSSLIYQKTRASYRDYRARATE